MKRLFWFFIAIIISSCSLDNKTGIWKDASNIIVENSDIKTLESADKDKQYEDIFFKNKIYSEEKNALNNLRIEIDPPIKIDSWIEKYATPSNNISNFYYTGNQNLISRSKKLSKSYTTKDFLNKSTIFYNGNLISYDHKGVIFIYSLKLKKKIFKYNFYKKKFKNIKKNINLILNEHTLYVADNLGYLYAINLKDRSVVWAKNYGIPFRSNLKFANGDIFLANQDNVIFAINSNTGEKKWKFRSSLTFLKSNFRNNIALDIVNKNLFFLNTSGELYSINYLTQKINWVLNFKNPSLAGDVDLFLSYPLILKNDSLTASTEKAVLNFDSNTSLKNWSFFTETLLKPIVTSGYTYIISKNDLLICLDNNSGEVIWSKNIYNNSKINKKIKNKFGRFNDFKIVNNKINLYSQDGYLLLFDTNSGNLINFKKISKNGIISKIIFLNNNMLLIDKKSRLLKYN